MSESDLPTLTRARLFQMMQAYKETSLVKTGIELGVFDHLAAGPMDVEAVSDAFGGDPRGTRILLNALAALRLVGTDGRRYWLAPGADELLVRESAGYAGDMVHVFASDWEWNALNRFAEAVRKGGTVLDEHAETPEYKYWEDFAAYAPVVAKPTADVLADAIGRWATGREHLDVLDLACGHGVYGYTVADRYPQATVASLDWENVLAVAASHAERMGVLDRTRFITGDMFEVSLGGPYDLVLITNVLHHFSEERATELLTRAASVVKPDGRVGVVGFTTSDALPADDPAPHLFSVLMLAWTAEGEVHSEAAYEKMYRAAGLEQPTIHTVAGLPFRVLLAGPA
ncbi:class I SAM-dependent methyltransferase [Gandjariella thermophila]|uniref:Hydroxyindole O-methyltransferase n=1 Tax=Gandjariella thermophila TaxID=1931992 RepID=A0A4D4JCW0_9PSEU|nr:class I SAM-dependent methyltransferase [Gandjariella thermophila]GDY31737.1 hydroxyindole O-methyltransferase [Gandjariella thermophila]